MAEPGSASGQSADHAAGRRRRSFAQLAAKRATARHHGRGYSRLVGFLKILLPGVALVIVIVIGLWQNLFGGGQMAGLQQVSGAQIGDRLIAPRFVGTDAKDRPFTLEATHADQLADNAAVVTFADPRGELLIDDGFIDMSAERGRFDRVNEQLVLEGNVDIRRSDGATFETEQLHVDMPGERAWSTVTVHSSGSFGDIEAEGGIDILQSGQTVIFKGPARLLLSPSGTESLP
ncbi:MAG: LPS export ABC transporter periplasmic protein LptC [Pseudomonadota bacterium]